MAGKARLLALLALFAGGTALGAAAVPSAFDFAGRYSQSFLNGNVQGERYRTTDELMVVATDRSHAYFNFDLTFFNGHLCSLSGIARLEGRALVYREAESQIPREPPCTLRIWRDGARLRWTDGENSCRAYCGARGSFTAGSMPWSSRRPISRATRARLLREFERDRNLP